MQTDIAALYECYGPMVVRRCRALLPSDSDAQDAAQDVFVRVLDQKKPIEDRGLSSFLWTVATRVCLNRIRDAREHADIEPMLNRIASSAPEEQTFFRLQLFGAARGENRDTGVMATMHYVDGATYAEVAAAFSMSESGVRKRLRGFLARTQKTLLQDAKLSASQDEKTRDEKAPDEKTLEKAQKETNHAGQ